MGRFPTRLTWAVVAAFAMSACTETRNPGDPDFAKGGGKGPTVNQAMRRATAVRPAEADGARGHVALPSDPGKARRHT